MITRLAIVSLLFVGGFGLLPATAQGKAGTTWSSLFDGKTLAGWDTWLGTPHASVPGLELPRDDSGQYMEPIGLNRDPRNVFQVVHVDGAPAIRITGEIYGALTSKREFDDFHLRLEFKWGKKKWQPRLDLVRDSGILYYAVGEHGVSDSKHSWMRSLECQIQERDVGDFWSVDGAMVDVEGVAFERTKTSRGKERVLVQHDPGGRPYRVPDAGTHSRIVKSDDHEKPSGKWNVVEVVCVKGDCIHIVNGKRNMVLRNSRHLIDGALRPLRRGKIQIQSEGAEIYYRNIAIRKATRLPW